MGIGDVIKRSIKIVISLPKQFADNMQESQQGDVLNSPGLYKQYSEIPEEQKSMLDDTLIPDEEFQMCITLGSGTLKAPHLTLTDQRLIKAKDQGMVGSDIDTYELDSISQVDYDEGLTSTSIEISGTGIDEDFEVSKLNSGDVDDFQKEVYKHK